MLQHQVHPRPHGGNPCRYPAEYPPDSPPLVQAPHPLPVTPLPGNATPPADLLLANARQFFGGGHG